MTVGELIAELGKFDPARQVVVDGYESGFDDPEVFEITMYPEGMKKYDSRYADYTKGHPDVGPKATAVCVSRYGVEE